MRRFQFSLRDLLLAMTLIALGVGLFVLARHRLAEKGLRWSWIFLSGPSGSMVGAGLGAPFKAKVIGAVIGASVGIMLQVWLGNGFGLPIPD